MHNCHSLAAVGEHTHKLVCSAIKVICKVTSVIISRVADYITLIRPHDKPFNQYHCSLFVCSIPE
jgi:uncharacterized protein YsxB (DUF464 family)